EVPLADAIETAAQQMTRTARQQAELLVVCSEQETALADLDPYVIRVQTKCDRGMGHPTSGIATSAVTGAGLEELAAEITRRLAALVSSFDMVPATADRCTGSLQKALAATEAALELSRNPSQHDLTVHELRHALDE